MNLFKRNLGAFFSADGTEGGKVSTETEKPDSGQIDPEKTDDKSATTSNDDKTDPKTLTADDVQKMIQAETDRVRTEYSKRLKTLEEEKDALIKEKMTESEKKDYELSKREKAIRDAEMKLLASNIEIAATNELAALDMPHIFKEFVKGETVEDTQKRAKELQKIWKEALNEEVQKRFTAGGRTITSSSGSAPAGSKIDMNALIRGAARK